MSDYTLQTEVFVIAIFDEPKNLPQIRFALGRAVGVEVAASVWGEPPGSE
jgi:hypothetical protein